MNSATDWETQDGQRLYVRQWQASLPKALVVVVHGLAEHSGRYTEPAERFVRSGLAVLAYDLRGHGHSGGSRAWVESFDQHVDDLLLVVEKAQEETGPLPLFLFGHSMGGLIVARTAATGAITAAGLVLSAPAVSVDEGLFPLLRKLASFGGRWFPKLRLVRLGSAMLSRDAEVVRQFRDDPLVFHGRIPTRTGAEILRASEEIWELAERITQPVLILQGTADAVVSPARAEAFYHAVASGDRTFRRCEGFYHDLPREPGGDVVLAEAATWIEQRCPKGPAEGTGRA